MSPEEKKKKSELSTLKNYKVLKFKSKDKDGKEIVGTIHENGENYAEGETFVTSVKRAQELDPEGKKIAEAKASDLKE